MKKLLLVVFVLLFVSMVATPVFASGALQEVSPENPLDLSTEDLFLVSLIASALGSALKLLADFAAKRKIVIKDWVKQVVVVIVAFVLAATFKPYALPSMPVFTGDLLVDLNMAVNDFIIPALITGLAWFGIAHLFYTAFLKKVQDKAGAWFNLAGYDTEKPGYG